MPKNFDGAGNGFGACKPIPLPYIWFKPVVQKKMGRSEVFDEFAFDVEVTFTV